MLERELELIGAGALGGLLKRKAKHMHALGTPCANCQTELQGPYCHVCGQPSDDQHRSILHLMWEGIEGLTHLDGRLGQTLPPLFIAPGKLARDHFEGRRQRHVPPFRLFLISLLVFMFVLEGLFHGGEHKAETGKTHDAVAITRQKLDEKFKQKAGIGVETTESKTTEPKATASPAGKSKGGFNINIGGLPKDTAPVAVKVDGKEIVENGDGADVDKAFEALKQGRAKALAARKTSGAAAVYAQSQAETGDKMEGWLKPRLKKAIENKEYYLMVLFTWAHRLAILLLPILAGLLALVYVRRRQFYIYDHLIVSMQFLSFVFLVSALAWIVPNPVRPWTVMAASIWTPINLYQTLRGAYGSKWYTGVIKTGFLWTSTLFLFSLLMVGLMTLALAEMA